MSSLIYRQDAEKSEVVNDSPRSRKPQAHFYTRRCANTPSSKKAAVAFEPTSAAYRRVSNDIIFFFLKNKRVEWDNTCTRYRAVSAPKSIPRGRSFPLTLPPTSCLFSSNWQKNRETNKNWQHTTVLLPTLEVWGNQSSSLKHFRKRKKRDCISSSDFPVYCCTSELHH